MKQNSLSQPLIWFHTGAKFAFLKCAILVCKSSGK